MGSGNREVLISKLEAVLQGPDGELFADILDRFFIRLGQHIDDEPLSEKEALALKAGRQALLSGDSSYFTPWEKVKKELDL